MSLFGVFAIYAPRVVNELGEKVQQEGYLGAFGMGTVGHAAGHRLHRAVPQFSPSPLRLSRPRPLA